MSHNKNFCSYFPMLWKSIYFFFCLLWKNDPQLMQHFRFDKDDEDHFLSSFPPGHSWLHSWFHRTFLPAHFLQANPSCLKLPKELILCFWQSEPLNPFLNLPKLHLTEGRSAHGSWMQMHHRPRQLPIFFCSMLSQQLIDSFYQLILNWLSHTTVYCNPRQLFLPARSYKFCVPP